MRFTGARGYLVTFRSVDPLYVLDLTDPTDPQVAGSLQVMAAAVIPSAIAARTNWPANRWKGRTW